MQTMEIVMKEARQNTVKKYSSLRTVLRYHTIIPILRHEEGKTAEFSSDMLFAQQKQKCYEVL